MSKVKSKPMEDVDGTVFDEKDAKPAKGRILRGGIFDVSSNEVANTRKFRNLVRTHGKKKLVAG